MEDKCLYVSSRGILKCCDVYNSKIGSSDERLELDQYLKIKHNDVVYVCNSAIKNFFENIFPLIKHRFILVSGDSDVSMPFDGFEQYIEDDKLIVWFSQNLVKSHPKLKHLPIGLDYHTLSKIGEVHPWGNGMMPVEQDNLLENIRISANPIYSRTFGCYVNFHFPYWGINTRGDRSECLEKVPRELCYFEQDYINRICTWKNMSHFIFVLCPYGGGLDTHRMWEALVLDCIPIIKSSGLDPLFEDLNVCIVKSWDELNTSFLLNYLSNMKPRCQEKLTLKYWNERIQSYKDKDV